jgi:hypothetical protein
LILQLPFRSRNEQLFVVLKLPFAAPLKLTEYTVSGATPVFVSVTVIGREVVPTGRLGNVIEFEDNETTPLPPCPEIWKREELPLVRSVTVRSSSTYPVTLE